MKKGTGWGLGLLIGLAIHACFFTSDRSGGSYDSSRSSYSQPSYHSQPPRVAENGSYYGQISNSTGRPKNIHVRGYYRKDGTYVRGHYRSAPRR